MNSKPIDASVDEKTSLLSSNPSDSSANVYSAPSEDSNPGALLTAPLLRSGESDVIDVKINPNSNPTEEQLRIAVLKEVGEHCCWGKKAGQNMQVSNIQELSAYHCIWETWSQSRRCENKTTPYYGEAIDPLGSGPLMNPWDIYFALPKEFENTELTQVVPHTDTIQNCPECGGRGQKQCNTCHGRGRNKCTSCDGKGFRHINDQREQCISCSGMGTTECSYCRGTGMQTCRDCSGQGRLKICRIVIASFTNTVFDEVLDISQLPSQKIQTATGECILHQEGYHLIPPQTLPYQELVQPIMNLYTQSENVVRRTDLMLHKQRITIRQVPVTRAVGNYNGKVFDFWVYGNDNQCYVPNYPMQCCCGCSVM